MASMVNVMLNPALTNSRLGVGLLLIPLLYANPSTADDRDIVKQGDASDESVALQPYPADRIRQN